MGQTYDVVSTSTFKRLRSSSIFLWKVENFLKASWYKYESQVFQLHDTKWQLELNPRGGGSFDFEHIGLHLVPLNVPETVLVDFSVSLMGFTGSDAIAIATGERVPDNTLRRDLSCSIPAGSDQSAKIGWSQFVSRKELSDPANGYMDKEDSLMIAVRIWCHWGDAIEECIASDRNVYDEDECEDECEDYEDVEDY